MDVTPQVSQEDSERRKKVVASSRPGQPGPGQYWEAWWQLGLVASQQLERPSLPRPASCCVGPTPRITRMPTRPQYNVPSIKMQHHHHHHPHNHPNNHHHHHPIVNSPQQNVPSIEIPSKRPQYKNAQYKNAPTGDRLVANMGLFGGQIS